MASQLQQLPCNYKINYSDTVIGGSILPFIITLDEANSNLYPAYGEYQKFSYIITANGSDTSLYSDLSHFVFGVCSEITNEDIIRASVKIDNQAQNVVIGSNVAILNPDKPTNCSGLKFDFPLNKVSGVMTISYELAEKYPIGQVDVCLFGGNVTASGLNICGPVCGEYNYCDRVVYQTSTVNCPVTVTPYAIFHDPVVTCCQDGPTITSGIIEAAQVNNNCQFTISQKLTVKMPLGFGAYVDYGSYSNTCDGYQNECN